MIKWHWVVEPEEWEHIVRGCEPTDLYAGHRLLLADAAQVGDWRLLVLEGDGHQAAVPLILRTTTCTDGWLAGESPTPYAGIVGDLPWALVTLPAVLAEAHVISAFIRLPPWHERGGELPFGWQVCVASQTAAIPLRGGIDHAFIGKSCATHRNQARRAAKLGFTASVARSPSSAAVAAFAASYTATMNRLDADPVYYPCEQGWRDYSGALAAETVLVTVQDASGLIHWQALFLDDRPMLHYHLSARIDQAHNAAAHLGFQAVSQWAIEHEFEHLHLGAGLGASNEDDLWRFKARIGRERLPLRFIGAIGDQERHAALDHQSAGSRFQSYVVGV